MSDRTEQERDLFCEALRVADPERRKEFLDQACAARPALRAHVERLLAAQVAAENFFAEAARAACVPMEAHRQP